MTKTDWAAMLKKAIGAEGHTGPELCPLESFVGEAALAIFDVTGGACVLKTSWLTAPATVGYRYLFQLVIRQTSGRHATELLGVYGSIQGAGDYPVNHWPSLRQYQQYRGDPAVFHNRVALQSHFEWMLTDPTSRVVEFVKEAVAR